MVSTGRGNENRPKLARALMAGYMSMIATTLIELGFLNVRVRNDWAIGDWLINYEGGFVRRGLAGQAAYLAGKAFHISPTYLILGTQWVLYGLLLFSVWRLVSRSSWSLWVMAFLFSPVTLGFPLLDPQAGFRKEEIYLVGLALLLLMLRAGQVGDRVILLYLSAVMVILALSHEALMCFVPYYLAAIGVGFHDLQRVLRVAALPVALGLICWLFAVTHTGSAETARQICASLGSDGVGFCGGAITALADSPEFARRQVQQVIASYHPYALYGPLLLLAILPAILAVSRLRKHSRARQDLRIILGGCAISCVISSVLFLYAVDWGRWIYIHVFSLFMLLVFVDQGNYNNHDLEKPWEFSTSLRSLCSVVLLVAYATTWTLPRLPTVTWMTGYISLLWPHQASR